MRYAVCWIGRAYSASFIWLERPPYLGWHVIARQVLAQTAFRIRHPAWRSAKFLPARSSSPKAARAESENCYAHSASRAADSAKDDFAVCCDEPRRNAGQGAHGRFTFSIQRAQHGLTSCPIPATRAGALTDKLFNRTSTEKVLAPPSFLRLRTSRALPARAPRRIAQEALRSSAKTRAPPKFFRCSAPDPSWRTGGNEAAIGASLTNREGNVP